MTKRKLVCAITGSTYSFGVDYFNKKVAEYGDIESLQKNFLTKKAKTYLSRGYSPQEIRDLLKIENVDDLPATDSPEMMSIVEYHDIKSKSKAKRITKTINFATHKSDPEVVEYINNIKKYE